MEQIIRDRAAFAQRVADESATSLTGQGLVLDTFQIQDITDDGSHLDDLGRPEAAKVGQIASIAEANARQAAEQARLAAEQEIAISQRQLALQEAERDRLTGVGEQSRRAALAEAEEIEGAATGEAEAEEMEKKATAFAQYNDAAVLQMLVEILPKVAAEVAAPMAAIDKLTVVSTNGAPGA